jgi:histidinol dehydrogenase
MLRDRESSAARTALAVAVQGTLHDVRVRGDAALVDHTRWYDRVSLERGRIEVEAAEMEQARLSLSPDLVSAIDFAASSVRAFHLATAPRDELYLAEGGIRCRRRVEPLGRVGLYSPGGFAGYPSSVIMTACAAKGAGVDEIVLCTPPQMDGSVAPAVLYAAARAGVSRVFRVGGAAAIAAMAYGTETIPAVDKIVGPGNEFVSHAKRIVYGQVGIDLIAGPSEVAVIADGDAPVAIVASDLLAQAEHGTNSWAVLLTDSLPLMASVKRAVDDAGPAAGQISCVVTGSLREAAALASELAPEHLEVFVRDPDPVLRTVRNCGAIFVGPYAGAPLGDYALGPNHVLPTGGSARFSSGLSTLDFVRFTNVIEITGRPSRELIEACRVLAEAERFVRHAEAVRARDSSLHAAPARDTPPALGR